MSFIYKWECNKTPLNIASILFAFAILIAIMILTITKIFDASFGWPIFAIGFVILTAATIYAQRRKYINLDKVKVQSTNLLGATEVIASPEQNNNYANDLKNNNKGELYSATSSNHVAAFDIQWAIVFLFACKSSSLSIIINIDGYKLNIIIIAAKAAV